VGTLCGLAPWIVFWVLVGNVPIAAAALTALVIAVLSLVVARVNGTPGRVFEIGAIGTFSVVAVLTFAPSQSFLERWVLTLSIAGVLIVALVCALGGGSFAREHAPTGPPTDVTRSEPFAQMRTQVTWIWVGVFAVMAVSSAIPPIVLWDNAILDGQSALSVVCYWVVPFASFCLAALASRTLSDRVMAAAADPAVVRRTTFVAFRELAIDELYYLAREKVEREVGAGMEAYDVNVGGAGTPLTGDESRESWPATYKVRERR
jgi:hypothetical protein